MTYIEKFEEIKAKFKNLNKTATKEEFAMQVTMTDEDCGGIFYVAYINGNFAVEPYDYYDNTVSVVCPSQAFIDILEGKLDPAKALEDGLVCVEGNLNQALALAKMVKKPRKCASKKPAERTEEKSLSKTACKATKESAKTCKTKTEEKPAKKTCSKKAKA